MDINETMSLLLIGAFCTVQIAYALSQSLDLYFFTRPVNWVDPNAARNKPEEEYPYIVLFYPVLRELESTMRTTFLSLAQLEYPKDKFSVVAIPNADDAFTVRSLRRLQKEFPFLQIIEVPATSQKSWLVVWKAWDRCKKAYWWHEGKFAQNRKLPPKKTRQLIYAFYQIAERVMPDQDFLVNYIDADSCPPSDHFLAAAAGMDVLDDAPIAGMSAFASM